MKSKNGYPYWVILENYIGYRIEVHLENKTYIGTLDWCSNSCICISNSRNNFFQWTRLPGKVIIGVNRIEDGFIHYSVNGEPKRIEFM
jgi:hypothetical protein